MSVTYRIEMKKIVDSQIELVEMIEYILQEMESSEYKDLKSGGDK